MDFSYEDKEDIIDQEINKRRSKWQLKAITWMDFEDVSQLLRIRICEKWHMWDQERPIEPWLNVLINNHIKNLIRDHYGVFSRPCLGCDANQGGDLCSIYDTQCSACPLYRKWEKKKKSIYGLKMPVSYNDEVVGKETPNVASDPENFIDYEGSIKMIHESMEKKLKPEHFKIYSMLYIENMEDEEVAKILGYKENKYNKRNRYKQIENYKKKFICLASLIIKGR